MINFETNQLLLANDSHEFRNKSFIYFLKTNLHLSLFSLGSFISTFFFFILTK